MKHTFHGKEYRAQLQVVDWRMYPSKKGGEPEWLVRQKQRLSKDKITVSVYILHQSVHTKTPFRGSSSNTHLVFYQTSNGKEIFGSFSLAWEKVKQWTDLSDDDLPKKFQQYMR